MGIASGDFDGDGDEDLCVTNIIGETYALYVNDGKGNFEDARTRAGLASPTAAYTGFGTNWFDYDNDGRLDLFVANGAVNVIEAQRGQPRPFRMKNQLFHNAGAGASPKRRRRRVPRSRAPTSAAARHWRHRQRRRRGRRGHQQRRPREAAAESGRGKRRQASLGEHQRASAFDEPLRRGRMDWRRADGAADPVAPRPDGRQLPVGQRRRVHFGLGSSPAIAAVIVQWPDGERERRRTSPPARVSRCAVSIAAASSLIQYICELSAARIPLYLQILAGITLGILTGVVLGKDAGPLGEIGRLVIQLVKLFAVPLLLFAILDAFLKTDIAGGAASRMVGITSINTAIALLIGLGLSTG